MSTSVGQIGLDLTVNHKQFKKQMLSINSLAKKTGAALAAGFSVAKLVQFGKQCIDLGSDLQEVQNVVDVTFPNMTSKINDFSKKATASFGLSETMAKKYSSTLGSMAKAFGFSESKAYDMGTTLAGLAGDVASFYNLSQDEAYTKLKSVFTGETESLKDLGVVMTQSALDAFALANGFGKTTKAMSEAEKVALRYQFVQDKLSAAQGDFARTSNSWANQTKILSLQFESLKATIGQGLIAAFTPVIKTINILLQKLQGLATSFKNLMEGMFGAQSSEADAFSQAASAAQATAESTGETASNLKKAKSFLAGFDVITKVSETSESGGSGTPNNVTGETDAGENDDSVTSGIPKKFEKLTESFDKFNESVKRLADAVKDGLSWAYENVLKPLGEWTMNELLPEVIDTLTAAFDFLTTTLGYFKPVWDWAWEYLIKPIANFVGDALIITLDRMQATFELLTTALETLKPVWDWIWKNFFEPIGKFVGAAITEFLDSFLEKLKLVPEKLESLKKAIENLPGKFEELRANVQKNWDAIRKAISDAVAKIKEKFGTIVGWFKEKYTAIKNVFANVKEWFGNKFTGALKAVKTAFKPVTSWFKEKYKAIKGVFANVKDWFSSKFTAAYNAVKKPFESIGSFFNGIYTTVKEKLKSIGTVAGDAIGGSFKSVINSVLSTVESTINKAIRFINSAINVINKLPGVNLGTVKEVSLPRLAQGGFVKKNTPQLAVIGDNRHQGEVVAPEDKLAEMAMNAVRMASGNDYSLEILKVLKEILEVLKELDLNIVIDGKKLKDIIVEKINQHTVQTGVCEIIM